MVQLCNLTMATVYGPLQWMSRPKVHAGHLLKTLGSTKTDIWEIVKSDQKCWFAKLEARPLLHLMLPSALSGCQSERSFLDSLTSTRKHFFLLSQSPFGDLETVKQCTRQEIVGTRQAKRPIATIPDYDTLLQQFRNHREPPSLIMRQYHMYHIQTSKHGKTDPAKKERT